MDKNKRIVVYALVIAVILLMSFTPLGYLKMPGIEISLLSIPVAVGAIILGAGAGAIFGGVFGITSFIQAFGMSPFGAALMSVSPIMTLIVCLIPRLAMGFLCGFIFEKLKVKHGVPKTVDFCIASLSAALLNTVFFMTLLLVCFGRTQYITDMQGGKSVLLFVLAFVGINGAVELIAALVAGGAISKAVYKAIKL